MIDFWVSKLTGLWNFFARITIDTFFKMKNEKNANIFAKNVYKTFRTGMASRRGSKILNKVE